jgi:hypothetical protein
MTANNYTTTFYFQEDFIKDWRRFETLTAQDPRFKNKNSDNKRGVTSKAIRLLIKVYNKKYTQEFLAQAEKKEQSIPVDSFTTNQEEQNKEEIESDTSGNVGVLGDEE